MRADLVEFLHRHRVAYLATAAASGEPHVVPVCFAVVADQIYIPLDAKPKRVPVERLRRVQDLLRNPQVALVVDDYAEDWARLRWLQVRGVAGILPPPGAPDILAALLSRYPQYAGMALTEAPLIRITPQREVEWSWSALSD